MGKTKSNKTPSDTRQFQPESPQNEGVDPLTEGNTLHPRDAARSEAAPAVAASTPQAAQAPPAAEVPNSDAEEQDAVAEGRVEPGAEEAETPAEEPAEPTPEEAPAEQPPTPEPVAANAAPVPGENFDV